MAATLMQLRARLHPRAQLLGAIVVGWAPFVILGLIERALGRPAPLLGDLSVHVRALVSAPLLVVADALLARTCAATTDRLSDEGFVADGDRGRFARLLARAEPLRHAVAVELLLAAIAMTVGLATLVGWVHPAGVVGGGVAGVELAGSRLWFGLVTLPLFVFLLGRALWRWTLWMVVLVALARLPLRFAPAHPDRRGGVAFLARPSLAFGVPFLLALSSLMCAGVAMQMRTSGASLHQYRTALIAFVALGELLAFAPLLAFTPRLFWFARATLDDYSGLATDYVRRFHRRWIAPPPARDQLLGTADLQALSDLGASYREMVEKVSLTPFAPRDLLALLVPMLLPALPLALATLPLEVVTHKLLELLVGRR